MKVQSLLLALGLTLCQINPAAAVYKRAGGAGPKASLAQSSSSSSATSNSQEVKVLQFENFGFTGYYSQVGSMSNLYSDDCSCELASDKVTFSGTNTPLNEEVSVHFRGPLQLNKFAYYVSSDYEYENDSGEWSRKAYFDASSQTAENVTFLTKAGKNSTCLGKALTYADSDGISEASSSTILAEDTLINSQDEFVIFSNISCGSSGLSNDCGVYRDGIPAYHGFYGTVKMFLFEFKMPTESKVSEDEVSNYNMPAIWLLNAQIPRTSQYSTSVNCSCWRSGCGEFDIFEVMNTTEANHLYSTIHDYQGTDNIETGMAVYGHMARDTTGTMIGGVSFDNKGNAITWLSNSTSFNESISASDVNNWIGGDGTIAADSLSSVSAAVPSSSSSSLSKKSDGYAVVHKTTSINLILVSIFSAFMNMLL